MPTPEAATVAADRSLVITRVFNAPRHLVFEAWTKEEHTRRWMMPKGFTIASCEVDCRPGGSWGCTMIAPDGSEHRCSGVYREIIPDERLVFTHGWDEDDDRHDTLVTVRFADEALGKTRMTLEQAVFRSVESRDLHVDGWSQSLDILAELLARKSR